MPDLDPPSSSTPIVPCSNLVKPMTNGAQKLQPFKTFNCNSVWDLNKKEGEVEECCKSENTSNGCGSDGIGVLKVRTGAEKGDSKSLEEYVKDWVQKRTDAGVSEHRCYLPFLVRGPKMVIFGMNMFFYLSLVVLLRNCLFS